MWGRTGRCYVFLWCLEYGCMLSLGPWVKKRFVLRIHSDVCLSVVESGLMFLCLCGLYLVWWVLGLDAVKKLDRPTHGRGRCCRFIQPIIFLLPSVFFLLLQNWSKRLIVLFATPKFSVLLHSCGTIALLLFLNIYEIPTKSLLRLPSSSHHSVRVSNQDCGTTIILGGFWHLHQLAPQLDPDQSRSNPSINHQSAAEEPQFPWRCPPSLIWSTKGDLLRFCTNTMH
jgi:hypothetical protein